MARPVKPLKRLSYTAKEVQAITGWNRFHLWRLIKAGHVSRVHYPGAGRSVFVDAASVEALFERGKLEGMNG